MHVSDVARANVLAVERPGEPGALTPANVCSGGPRAVGEPAGHLRKRLADRSRGCSAGRARRTSGTSFADGVERFATESLR